MNSLLYTYIRLSCCSLLLIVCIGPSTSWAQQTPFLGTYSSQPQAYNPAAIGEGDLTLIHRRQWLDFPTAIAPTTYALIADFSGMLPFGDRVGLALNLANDQSHIFGRTNMDASFAYHLVNTGEHRFSLGAMAGFLNQHLDFGDLKNSADIDNYTGSGNRWVFDGGPGLFYQFTGKQDTFSFSAALPQLFTSDLVYTDLEQNFDNQLHLLAGIQYRTQAGALGIEPSLFIRAMQNPDKSLAKSTVDVNARLLFMENRFWLSGGVRINGDTYLGGIGANLAQKLRLQGLFEYHTTLGASAELAVTFKLGNDKLGQIRERKPKEIVKNEKPKRERKKINRPVKKPIPPKLLTDLALEKESIARIVNTADRSKFTQVDQRLSSAGQALNLAGYTDLTITERRNKVVEAESYLQEAKVGLNELIYTVQSADNVVWKADRLVQLANRDDIEGRELSKANSEIKEEGEALRKDVRITQNEYLLLDSLAKDINFRNNLTLPFANLVQNRDFPALKARLTKEWMQVPGTDASTKIKVESPQPTGFVLSYEFPFVENSYQLGADLDRQTMLLEHISKQVKKMEYGGLKVDQANLKMALQTEIADMARTTTSYPYLGELNSEPTINVIYVDTNDGSRRGTIERIKEGQQTSITQLACLKLISAKQYLAKKGVSPDIMKSEISGPNYDKENSLTFAIEIHVRY